MVDCSRQAGAERKVTDEMVAAGVAVYEGWEPSHVFEGMGGPAPYAIRELVRKIFCAMEDSSPSAL